MIQSHRRWLPAAAMAGLFALIGLVLLVTNPSGGEADYPWYESSEEMAEQADAVLLGEVVAESSARYDDIDHRVVTVEVEWDGKGTHPSGDLVSVKLVSGNSPGAGPHLAVGSRYVLFVEEYDTVPASLLSPTQGYYEVRDGELVAHEDNPVVLHRQLLLALGLE